MRTAGAAPCRGCCTSMLYCRCGPVPADGAAEDELFESIAQAIVVSLLAVEPGNQPYVVVTVPLGESSHGVQ
jgi:hypothetical protein